MLSQFCVCVCVLQAWESDVESTIVSKLHSEVSQVMGSIGVSHNIERITDDGLFSADILIEDDKVIVEVDGPHHFTVNTHQPLGMSWQHLLCILEAALCCKAVLLLYIFGTLVLLYHLMLHDAWLRYMSLLVGPLTYMLCFRCNTLPA